MATKSTKKTAVANEVKAEAKTETKTEVKAAVQEETKAATKCGAKKCAAKAKAETKPVEAKPVEEKVEEKPVEVKPVEVKPAEPTVSITLEYKNEKLSMNSVVESIKAAYAAEGKTTEVKSIEVFVQPETKVAYYLINGEDKGSVNL